MSIDSYGFACAMRGQYFVTLAFKNIQVAKNCCAYRKMKILNVCSRNLAMITMRRFRPGNILLVRFIHLLLDSNVQDLLIKYEVDEQVVKHLLIENRIIY